MLFMGSAARKRKRESQEVKNVVAKKMPMGEPQECRDVYMFWNDSTIARRQGGCVREYTFLLCISVIVHMLCPAKRQCRGRKEGDKVGKHAYIFPTEDRATLAAVDVSYGVVACSHLTVIWFTLNNVNPAQFLD
jgi:hypothetical protein